jgi:hypothetical protein
VEPVGPAKALYQTDFSPLTRDQGRTIMPRSGTSGPTAIDWRRMLGIVTRERKAAYRICWTLTLCDSCCSSLRLSQGRTLAVAMLIKLLLG